MSQGRLLATAIAVTTGLLVTAGTLWPSAIAASYGGGKTEGILSSTSTPEAAVNDLTAQLKLHALAKAYSSLANKAEFSEADFERDLLGTGLSLRTYATLDSVEVRPLHQSATDADLTMKMHWSSVVGNFDDARDVHAVKVGNRWALNWPLKHESPVPPQVIPVNYLRWDVIYRGAGDDWGSQDVEAPHVRIVDMHPLSRAEGVVVMGELLNEDVVPAFVSVKATLVTKAGETLDSEGSFDMISHTLLPKQVTPFIIHFPGTDLSKISTIRMEPTSVLVAASADPVVEIENQQYQEGSGAAVTGQLTNQSGHTVNVSHVLTTFYDANGQVLWVGGQYIDRALQPQTPVDFRVPVPQDLAGKVKSERTVVSTYIQGNS
ncbi:FxLYD domain-containing protein [Terriglobus sp. 2YAB30_2]|uniref:FxLYD domain-containing protein n=1 Tax=Terriglobus sp. 2YAB30_2 TaxID=3233023 RepID=UPI003F9DEBAC